MIASMDNFGPPAVVVLLLREEHGRLHARLISHRIDLTTNGAGTDSFDAASNRMDLYESKKCNERG